MKKKLVIVGNKDNANNIAETIDSFDLVCRCNRCNNYGKLLSGIKTDYKWCEDNSVFIDHMSDENLRIAYKLVVENTKHLIMDKYLYNININKLKALDLYPKQLLDNAIILDKGDHLKTYLPELIQYGVSPYSVNIFLLDRKWNNKRHNIINI